MRASAEKPSEPMTVTQPAVCTMPGALGDGFCGRADAAAGARRTAGRAARPTDGAAGNHQRCRGSENARRSLASPSCAAASRCTGRGSPNTGRSAQLSRLGYIPSAPNAPGGRGSCADATGTTRHADQHCTQQRDSTHRIYLMGCRRALSVRRPDGAPDSRYELCSNSFKSRSKYGSASAFDASVPLKQRLGQVVVDRVAAGELRVLGAALP